MALPSEYDLSNFKYKTEWCFSIIDGSRDNVYMMPDRYPAVADKTMPRTASVPPPPHHLEQVAMPTQ